VKTGKTLQMLVPILIILILSVSPVCAGICRLETARNTNRLKEIFKDNNFLVSLCPHCSNTDPVPLRAFNYESLHTEPQKIDLVFHDISFPVSTLNDTENWRADRHLLTVEE
jgi:hypothetical protein